MKIKLNEAAFVNSFGFYPESYKILINGIITTYLTALAEDKELKDNLFSALDKTTTDEEIKKAIHSVLLGVQDD